MSRKRSMTYEECHRLIDGIDNKLCSICENLLPCNEEYYYKNKNNKIDGYHTYCKKCTIKKSRKNRQKNPEIYYAANKRYQNTPRGRKSNRESWRRRRERGYSLNWQRANEEKVKEYARNRKRKQHEISNEEWGYCRDYFNNSCAYCGMTWEQHFATCGQDLHKEHVIHEGRNDIRNCVPSCKACNSEKHKFSLNTWYNENNEKYDRVRYLRIYMWLRYDCSRIRKTQ